MEVLEEIGKKIAKLIDVKSIVTLMLTIVFCILTVKGNIPQGFLEVYLIIVGFYFGTQYQKKENKINSSESGEE